MQKLYSQDKLELKIGQKFYWGSMHGSSQALALIEFVNTQKQVLLLITPDIASYNNALKSLNFYNSDTEILTFDNWEVLAFDKFSPHPDITSNRLKTLSKLPNLKKGIVITTIESLFQRLCPLEFSAKYSFMLRLQDKLNITNFSAQLTKIGYRRVNEVIEHGEFNIKGALIDLYPMGAKQPYRIDLFDDEIESIRIFDAATQRSIANTNEIALLPAREFATDKENIELFKQNYLANFNSSDDFIYQEVTQGRLPSGIEFYLSLFFNSTNTLFDYLPANTVIATFKDFSLAVNDNYQEIQNRYTNAKLDLDRAPLNINQVYITQEQLFSQVKQRAQIVINTTKNSSKQHGINFDCSLMVPLQIKNSAEKPLLNFLNFIAKFNSKILIVCDSQGRQNVLSELLTNNSLSPKNVENWQEFNNCTNKLCTTVADLDDGIISTNFAIITESELFGRDVVKQKRRRRAKHKDFDEAIKSLIEIKENDPIVHEQYGVGRYLGLITEEFDGQKQDFIAIQYANNAKLMVPIGNINLVSRYSGIAVDNAPLHRLGSAQWAKARKKASDAIIDVAAELLEIYAKREAQQGFAFPLPEDDYNSFVAEFAFEETPDQLKTMDEVLTDMQAAKPMDRLVCGDVGFGKTEIAMRAAFLAVAANKQVTILAPTTLLVNQHLRTFKDRFTNFPVTIAALSRFQKPKEQTTIKQLLAAGKIDIVIGTHKLLQSDIKYKRLGLIIIDEEHRFGVRQKETLKKLRAQSDILTMTATPIPRTLNMALGSLRSMSIIATPPAKRSAIKTFVKTWDEETIKEACYREIHRSGQIFVVHNDIDSIDNMAQSLKEIMPNARIRIAHGQMPSKELERIMSDFYHARFNILVCTTIIETGIDIPNANTIIINNAQNFGLAQLHQLRGRVGRSHHRAYAYLIIKSHQNLSPSAQKRIAAIESLEELGAGFMLANHDLEIRGAGDLLGDNQSGKINEIGFNLYNDLLKRAISALRSGDNVRNSDNNKEVETSFGIACIIPDDYMFDVHERLVLYKRIASANNNELKELQIELIDRFGLLPDATKNLFASAKLKLLAQDIGVQKINIYDNNAHIFVGDNTTIAPQKIITLIQTQPQIYKLKGQNQLVYQQKMPEDINRIEIVEKLLLSLRN